MLKKLLKRINLKGIKHNEPFHERKGPIDIYKSATGVFEIHRNGNLQMIVAGPALSVERLRSDFSPISRRKRK